jgi:hypothetical protein
MTEQSKIWQVEKAFLPVGLKSLAAFLHLGLKRFQRISNANNDRLIRYRSSRGK